MASFVPATTRSRSLDGSSDSGGLIKYFPSLNPTRTPATGPAKGISEICNAQLAPKIASCEGDILGSKETTLAITCVSTK